MSAVVKYPFGETPSEVIQERCDTDAPCFTVFEQDADHSISFGPDDLLTVLIALKMAGPSFWPIPTDTAPKDTLTGKLRIEILAALGIDESGAE